MAWTVVSFVELQLWIEYVPQYTTFLALYQFANGFAGLMSWTIGLGGGFSEAYNNGKKKLTQYYLAQAWKYTGLIQFLLISVLLVVVMILKPTLIALGLGQYILSIPFIIPSIIREFQQPYNNFSSNVIISTGHVNFLALCQLLEAGLAILTWYIFIPVLNLPAKYGTTAIIWLIPCGEMVSICIKIIINYIYINRKIMKVKIPLYQTFLVPIISTTIIYTMGRLYVHFIFNPMNSSYGTIIALIPLAIIFILIVPFFVYMPLTALIGAWDKGSIDILNKATKISGLGKIFVLPMLRSVQWASKKTDLAEKFAFDDSEALLEAKELMLLKNSNLEEEITILAD